MGSPSQVAFHQFAEEDISDENELGEKRKRDGGGGGGEDTFIDAILTRKLNQKERNERPATLGGGGGRGGVSAGELKWPFNQCPFLNTSHEINDRK